MSQMKAGVNTLPCKDIFHWSFIFRPNIRASMVACVTLVLDWIATTLSLSIVHAGTMSFFALLKIVEVQM